MEASFHPALRPPAPASPNRATRRAFDKAALCLSRGSRIPLTLRQTLKTQVPGALVALAGKRGLKIMPDGCVIRAGLVGTGTAPTAETAL